MKNKEAIEALIEVLADVVDEEKDATAKLPRGFQINRPKTEHQVMMLREGLKVREEWKWDQEDADSDIKVYDRNDDLIAEIEPQMAAEFLEPYQHDADWDKKLQEHGS